MLGLYVIRAVQNIFRLLIHFQGWDRQLRAFCSERPVIESLLGVGQLGDFADLLEQVSSYDPSGRSSSLLVPVSEVPAQHSVVQNTQYPDADSTSNCTRSTIARSTPKRYLYFRLRCLSTSQHRHRALSSLLPHSSSPAMLKLALATALAVMAAPSAFAQGLSTQQLQSVFGGSATDLQGDSVSLPQFQFTVVTNSSEFHYRECGSPA